MISVIDTASNSYYGIIYEAANLLLFIIYEATNLLLFIIYEAISLLLFIIYVAINIRYVLPFTFAFQLPSRASCDYFISRYAVKIGFSCATSRNRDDFNWNYVTLIFFTAFAYVDVADALSRDPATDFFFGLSHIWLQLRSESV